MHTAYHASHHKKITVNAPEQLLKAAVESTGLGITKTIVEGLQEIERREKRSALRQFRGKLKLNINLPDTRR